MLKKSDVIAMLTKNFQKQLQETQQLPEAVARGYKNWVHGLIQQARQKMQNESQPVLQQDANQA